METWISVNERLPDENVAVFITNGHGWYSIGSLIYTDRDGWFWTEITGDIFEHDGRLTIESESNDLDVTHWHEFPKPYKP